MPRVNRDMQRRMAARRERERRRPGGTERRYRFATPESPVESDETLLEQDGVLVRVGRRAGADDDQVDLAIVVQPVVGRFSPRRI